MQDFWDQKRCSTKRVSSLLIRAFILSALFALTGCGQLEADEIEFTSQEFTMENIEQTGLAADGQGLFAVWRKEVNGAVPDIVSDRYIVDYEYTAMSTDITYQWLAENVKVYDLQTGQQLEVTQKEWNKHIPEECTLTGMEYYDMDGQTYLLGVLAARVNALGSIEGGWLQMDIEGQCIRELDENEMDMIQYLTLEQIEYCRSADILTENALWEANGFMADYRSWKTGSEELAGKHIKAVIRDTPYGTDFYVNEGEVELIFTSECLPEHNEALYAKFPELQNYRGEDHVILLHLPGFPTPEEIVRLLLEDGQEISFDGVAMYSIRDHQEHQISSFEDWYEWNGYGTRFAFDRAYVEDGLW